MTAVSPPAAPAELPPVDHALFALAPLHLPNRRSTRYVGDDLFLRLDELAPRDQLLLRELYANLSELLNLMVNPATDDPGRWDDLGAWVARHDLDLVFEESSLTAA